jgi:Ca2+-binding RTX toxin-like protein
LRYNAEALQLTADLAEGSIQTEFGIDIVSGFDVLIFNIQGELKIQGNERDETLRFSADHGGVFGSGGNDLLVGLSQGSYFIDGGSGNDTIRSGAADFGQGRGGTGNDLIFGGRGVQDFEGGTGNDTIHAKAGNDALRGNDGNDILYGGDGGDILIGDEGNDKLCGGDGGDSFDCNDGADTVFGGDGQDSFRIYFGYGKTPSGTVIRDFRPSEGETLSLYAFPIAGGPLVPMYFNGTDSFNHVAGEVRYTPISGKVVLQCDVDGDGRADFSIKLLGLASIDANDLIFGA